jgi:DNA-binding SARP family transcriptional activator/pimeloyl-ACP methyl ester carboxylesterase
MSELRLFSFGPPRLEHRGENVSISLRKALALLNYLAVRRGKYSRDELATLFWPESDQSGARANLRRTLYVINKDLGEEIVSSDKEIVFLNPQIDIWTDVEQFRRYIEESSLASESLGDNVAQRTELLEKAAVLYKGDFLAGFTLPDCPEFDEWQFFEAENLRGSLASILQQLVSIYEAQGDFAQAIAHARHWLSLDPIHEPAHRLLMELYAKSGQHAAALRQYKECERLLNQELGVPPQPETTDLYQSIRLHREIVEEPPARVNPAVEYVASGDVHIAYVVMGDGPVDIIFVCGYISHMEQVWELPELLSFFEELASFSRVILFDRRGVGLSDRVGYPPTLEDTLDDLLAVMGAAGSRHPVLFGYLEGGPASMLFTATYPERVSGLILYGTRAKWTRSGDYPWTITREQYDRWLQYIYDNWGEPLNLIAYAPSRVHEPAMRDWWAKLMRLASSPGGIKAVLEVMRDIDVREILPTIRAPTLILHRRDDKAIRVGAARHLAGQIPGAKYVELEGDDHWFFLGDSQTILREMETFIHNLGSPAVPEYMLATILLIELLDENNGRIDLTPMQLDTTHAFFHREVARFNGSEVSWKEGCFTATFDGPTRAIHCANAIIDTAIQQDVTLRCGLHTGECEFSAGDLVGAAVQIVAGVLQSAAPNEVLVSSTVKDLVLGSGFKFSERDQIVIEGVSGRWGIYTIT